MSDANETRYGRVVHRDSARVVRLRVEDDGAVTIIVHPLRDGVEYRPVGFLVGVNYLRLEPPCGE